MKFQGVQNFLHLGGQTVIGAKIHLHTENEIQWGTSLESTPRDGQ